MACAFQSGTASVYLEIQWWFVKAPEPSDSEEDIDAQEVQGNLSLSLYISLGVCPFPIKSCARLVWSTPTHEGNKGIQFVSPAIPHKHLMLSNLVPL